MSIFARSLFSIIMVLAGFLLFQVQPLMAKFILPWFGGSASTWTVCILFFQAALLIGYAYAYGVTRPLTIRHQAILQMGIVMLALFFLPITPSEAMKPMNSDNPVGRIVTLLILSVGVPYVILSTTSPLLQRWLAHTDSALLTSRFFAFSNFGSLLGLLSYPFLFERIWSSPEQTRWWSYAFAVYAVLAVAASGTVLLSPLPEGTPKSRAVEGTPPAESAATTMGWIFYAALGSILLLATTNHISEWTIVVPFLWVLPLSLYLLTYIVVFGHQQLYDRHWFLAIFGTLCLFSLRGLSPDSPAALMIGIGLQSLTLFVGCMICHGEMVRLQPPADRLARFYMMVALGGALGGSIVTLVAPLIFVDYFEYLIAIGLTGSVAILLCLRVQNEIRRNFAFIFAFVFVIGFARALIPMVSSERNVVDRIRNFYGVVKVVKSGDDASGLQELDMLQTGIPQGSQYLAPKRRQLLPCAFRPMAGISRAIANVRKHRAGSADSSLRIGNIGLGVGLVAALGKRGDAIRVYELNPAVTELANRHFTFLHDTEASVEVIHGDGRLMLERELLAGPQHFDVLVVDAFRGSSPPLHLMTAEAFEIYLKHLAPDGVLAVNFDLEEFDLAPLHRGLAAKFDLKVKWFQTPEDGADCGGEPTSWALYSRDQKFFESPEVLPGVSPWRDQGDSRLLWTDANSSLMSVINWDRFWKHGG